MQSISYLTYVRLEEKTTRSDLVQYDRKPLHPQKTRHQKPQLHNYRGAT